MVSTLRPVTTALFIMFSFLSHIVSEEKLNSLNTTPVSGPEKSFTFFITTFNAGGRNPPRACDAEPGSPPSNDSICNWLKWDKEPDLVVIGLQEMQQLTLKNYVSNKLRTNNNRQEKWLDALDGALHEGDKYFRLVHMRLLGLLLVIYRKPNVQVSKVHTSSAATGYSFVSRVGNKGAIGISMRLNDQLDVCFVNAHLAAGEMREDVSKRNSDVSRISRKMNFSGKSITGHQALFWMGDLNYRLSDLPDGTTRQELIEKCKKNEFAELLQYDELRKEKDNGMIFEGYKEGEITFKPTFKYEPGTNDWQMGEKMRKPAWCDRILYKQSDKWDIVLDNYQSVESVVSSDHKPVRATFVLKELQESS